MPALTSRYGFADAPTSAILGNASLGWTTLGAALNPSGTAVTVASATGFPSALEFDVLVGLRDVTTGIWSNAELLHVTVTAGTAWTVTRGDPSLTHAIGESVSAVLTANGVKHNPGALTTAGDMPYLNASGRMDRLAAPADGTYGVSWATGVPSWSAIMATAPASPVNSIQFNNAGVFGGSANLIFDGTKFRVGVPESALPALLQGYVSSNALITNDISASMKATAFGVEGGGIGVATIGFQGYYADVYSDTDIADTWGYKAYLDANGFAADKMIGYYVYPFHESGGSAQGAIAFWSAAQGGTTTNAYPFWADEDGVFRIRADNTFNSVYQAIPALYNPQFAKYTPGATDYERIVLGQWSSNVAQIGTEAGGTGTLRAVKIIGASLDTPATLTANGIAVATQTYVNAQGFLTSVIAHNLLSATHGDTTAASVSRGDVITGQGASAKWVRLAKGTANQVLAMDGTATDVLWVTPAAGGVTSVALSLPAFITVSGSPVTTTGTLTGTLVTQVTKTFLAGPTSGADAAPTFRVIAAADVPDLTATYSPVAGNASLVTVGTIATGVWSGTAIAVAKGGTGSAFFTVAGPTATRTYTFPNDNATVARTDAGQTFTGVQAFTAPTIATGTVITEAVGTSALVLTGATQTSSFPVLSATQTWNNSGTTFTLIKAVATTTASAAASLLLDLQAGASPASILYVDKLGLVTSTGNGKGYMIAVSGQPTVGITRNSTTGGLTIHTNDLSETGSGSYAFLNGSLIVASTTKITWSASNISQPASLILGFNAAATLQLGADLNGAAISQAIVACNGITGQNRTGGNLTIASGKGTDLGAVSSLIFQTPTVGGATSGTAQSLATRLTLSSAGATFVAGITTIGGAVFHTTSSALTDGAGAAAGTLGNAPAIGNPTKWIGINDNGTTRYIPAW